MPIQIWIAVAVTVGLIVWGIVDARSKARRARAVWQRFANEYGGQHLLPSGWASGERERIERRIGAVVVTMETYTVRGTESRRAQTRWVVECAAPVFKLYREGVMSSVGKSLGSQDVVLGVNSEFDQQFMVKCSDRPAVATLWTPRSMEQMLASFGNGLVNSDGETIELIHGGRVEDSTRMQAGFEIVAALAGADEPKP